MKFLFFLIAFLGLSSGFNIDEYRSKIIKLSTDPTFIQQFDEKVNELRRFDPGYYTPIETRSSAFDCTNLTLFKSRDIPTSVHALRPGDINVVAALGDSITAALGAEATSVLGLIYEYRGRSWSVGGKDSLEQQVTVPNILKKFNPNLLGFTTDWNTVVLNKDGVGFNAAVSGAVSNDLKKQARVLIDRIKKSPSVNLHQDWKMITLFVGGNDLCDFCDNKTFYSAKNYANNIKAALDMLHAELPRTFVNVVQLLKVNEIKELNKGPVCSAVHSFVCKCIAFPKDEEQEKSLVNELEQYKKLTQEMVDSGVYDDREDFTVVIQPMFMDFSLPRLANGKIDYSFLAPDCFHYSRKGHAMVATALWNNLLQPVGSKATTSTPETKIVCPSQERPFLFTKKN